MNILMPKEDYDEKVAEALREWGAPKGIPIPPAPPQPKP